MAATMYHTTAIVLAASNRDGTGGILDLVHSASVHSFLFCLIPPERTQATMKNPAPALNSVFRTRLGFCCSGRCPAPFSASPTGRE